MASPLVWGPPNKDLPAAEASQQWTLSNGEVFGLLSQKKIFVLLC